MYYTTSGSYRKTKMFIDYANIALTIVIGVLFILICFLRSASGILFPGIFLAGTLMNGLTCFKRFMNDNKRSGIALAVVTFILLMMTIFTWFVVTR